MSLEVLFSRFYFFVLDLVVLSSIYICYIANYIYIKGMSTPSSIFAWEIPWTEESGRLHSMGSQRAGHTLVTKQKQQ